MVFKFLYFASFLLFYKLYYYIIIDKYILCPSDVLRIWVMARHSDFKIWLEKKLERHDLYLEELGDLHKLVDIVDGLVFPGKSQVHFDFKETLILVFLRMPEEDAQYLINGRVFYFIIPTNSIVPFKAMVAAYYLCVDPQMFAAIKPSDKIYLLAHELAHVYLDHPPGYALEKKELEADGQVIKWGFEEELRSCLYNYLYGVGLDRLRWKNS
jgi:hypothetical protein